MQPTVPDITNAKTKAQFNRTKCPPFSRWAPFLNLKASTHASFDFAVVHTHTHTEEISDDAEAEKGRGTKQKARLLSCFDSGAS